MDTFNDAALSPDDLKMLTLQFMGQHLTGELKTLEQNIVSRNNTLQGMVINPEAVLNTIPTNTQPITPQPSPQLSTAYLQSPPSPQGAVNLPYIVQSEPVSTPPANQNQLEFSFETSPLSERIFDALERIEKKLIFIEEKLYTIDDSKKKD
jgi:hypothetical protein